MKLNITKDFILLGIPRNSIKPYMLGNYIRNLYEKNKFLYGIGFRIDDDRVYIVCRPINILAINFFQNLKSGDIIDGIYKETFEPHHYIYISDYDGFEYVARDSTD